MDREYRLDRTIVTRKVVDDGWNLPEELIEFIDLDVYSSRKYNWDEFEDYECYGLAM